MRFGRHKYLRGWWLRSRRVNVSLFADASGAEFHFTWDRR